MNIPILEQEGFEADDIIGTVAKKAEKKNFKVFMVTPDKDFSQLVSENIFLCKPARMGNGMEIWGTKEVNEKFEVNSPEQVIDFLGMMGDSVDNIPGLPGVGEKTAKKFLKEYGSLENLLSNSHLIPGKLGEKITNNKELGIISKELAKIILDVPIDYNLKDFKLTEPDKGKVIEVFNELEFRRIKETFFKIYGTEVQADNSVNQPISIQTDLFDQSQYTGVTDKKTNSNSSRSSYQFIENIEELKFFVEKLMNQEVVSFDTETETLNSLETKLIGISFSWEKHTGYFISFNNDKKKNNEFIELLKPFFENNKIEKVGHNLKFDIKVLFKYGISVCAPIYDTMIAHYIINPDMRHNLDSLAESYLNHSPISEEDLIGKKGKNQKSIRDISIEEITKYSVQDPDLCLQLKEIFDKEIKDNNLLEIFSEVELPIIEVLSFMEKEGIKIDEKYLKSLEDDFQNELNILENKIFQESGENFNLNSPKQLGEVLFNKLNLVSNPKKTKTGQFSTSEEVLSALSKDHKIISNILEWRSLDKLLNTYVRALPNEINSSTGRIHTKFNQAVTSTGRLSSNNPNLQNIPIRTENGQKIRKAFTPRDKDFILMCADYSQIELRVIASLSGDINMIDAFNKDEDIHTSTASRIFNVHKDKVSREQRSNAKTVNFGIIYGVSAFGLSQQTDLNRKESKILIDNYYESYPTLKEYMSKQIDFARENGYVETLMGRRRYLTNINSQNGMIRSADERNAVNAPIQGSAADIIKIAMKNIFNILSEKQFKSKMILQVHDELVFDVHLSELDKIKKVVKNSMENAVTLDIPLKVDIGTGKNWLEAH